jgi:hypothetical protein
MAVSFQPPSGNPVSALQTGTAGYDFLKNQTLFSGSFFYTFTGTPATGITTARNVFSFATTPTRMAVWVNVPTTASSLTMNVMMFNATGTTQSVATMVLQKDIVYHVAFNWDATLGKQEFFLNGLLTLTNSVTGNTRNDTTNSLLIWESPITVPWKIADLSFWNGYKLTLADAAALRDGAAASTIGTGATARVSYTFAGTTGATPAIGNAGLKDSLGTAAYDFTTITNSWTGAYSPQLAFVPPAACRAAVMASGSLVKFTFTVAGTGAATNFVSAITTPTVAVNGTSLGALIPVIVNGGWNYVATYRLPGGVVATPTDVVTITASGGWANTAVGLSTGLSAAVADNFVGRSAYGADASGKSFRPGVNFPWGVSYSVPYCLLANLASKVTTFSTGLTISRSGVISMATATFGTGAIISDLAPSGIAPNQYIWSYPDGYYLIAWDDLDLANPTTLSLVAAGAATITEVTSSRNFGSGGLGQVRVYQYIHTGATTFGTGINVRFDCPTKAGHIGNVWISPPWGFTFTTGTPATIDRSNPLAIDAMVMARFPNGLGSVRAIDSTWVAGGQGFGESEPEHTALITDVFPGMAAVQPMPGVNSIRPWDPSVTPYVYSPWFGTTYQATLGAAITDTGSTDAQGRLVSTITINDAATAPIMYGQMLQVDSEYMSVLSVSGTSVTVRRGSRASTPATHSTGVGTLGSITVMYRIAANLSKFGNNILFMELVFASPHTAITGPLYGFSVTATWPDPVDAIKGLTTPFYLNNGTKTLMVTGPSTALIFAPYDGNSGSAATTCNQTYTLNPAVNFIRRNTVGGNSYTVEAIPAVSNALNANPHISIPIGANDDMVDSIARRVRDIITPGKTVWLEMGDEPWNWAAAWWHMANHSQAMSRLLHGPTASQLAYYADRVDQVRQRFEDRFNEGGRNRGGEIRSILNQSVGGRPDMMTHAGTQGHKVGAVAVAPYINTHKNIANGTAFLGATDAEMVDLAIIDNWHGKFGLWTGLAGTAGTLAAYNSTFGKSAVLYCYEAGDEHIYPPPLSTGNFAYTIAAAVSASDTTITLSAGQGASVIIGSYLLLENDTQIANNTAQMPNVVEWVQVTGVSGDVLTVTRARFGTTATARSGTQYARTWWVEKQRDMIYHPNWAIYTNDYHALLQSYGFVNANHYAYVMPWPSNAAWGVYHNAYQLPGKGDGTDGKADNRLYLATPGQAHSLPSTTEQDHVTVSTRGYAINQWMGDNSVVTPPPPPVVKRILFRRG